MIKKIFLVLLSVSLMGCASGKLPKYLTDRNPYKKTFYAPYVETLAVTRQVLEKSGWKIAEEADPSEYEQSRSSEGLKQTLLFMEVRPRGILFFPRWTSINVYVSEISDATEVEIRYHSVHRILIKSFQGYKNNSVVNRILAEIAKELGQE